jgi:predicted deacylase
MVVKSKKDGPVIWLTACGHGDEVGGIVVIHEVFKMLKKINILKGSIYAFPLMNPLGFEISSRHVTPSQEDLNRSFPGNKDGSLAQRIAEKIFTTIIKTKPSAVLDLHNDWIKSVPYIILESRKIIKNNNVNNRIRNLSNKAGFITIIDTEDLKNTLTRCLIKNGIPALTFELGESYIVNEANIQYGFRAIWNILSYLEMVTPIDYVFESSLKRKSGRRILYYSDKPLSSSSGIIRFMVSPGELVKRNQPIAKIFNTFGKLQETMFVLNDGIALGHTDSAVAFPSVPVLAFRNFK